MELSRTADKLLIAGISPYFLEKGRVWFEENETQILEAAKTQPFFKDNTLYLQEKQNLSLSELLRKLDELGYEKVFQVADPGEFSHKGGAVEIFPILTAFAFRVEFVGNIIDQIETLAISAPDETKTKEILTKRLKSQKLFSDLKGLKDGDYLVHLDHGVAKFIGYKNFQFPITNGQSNPVPSGHLPQGDNVQNPKYQILDTKYYTLEYAQGDTLFVPVGLERKLSRYVGFADPHISRLSSPFWLKTKRKIKEEVEKLAKELLELYAQREIAFRKPYEKFGEIGEKVAETFPYKETPDQLEALKDIEQDLSLSVPMDRIVCGDVGFGKTEIALRAMVHGVENNHQTALLAPTTILAYQHYQNFLERIKHLPIRIALLSRLQSKKEQEKILSEIKSGTVDMVIGTHRILSGDVAFKNLGILVIDDEQRFGVRQKEKLRELRSSLDMLSLSATPIPRTLYMALSSLKKISLVQIPPEGRVPIHTIVAKRSEKIVKKAIEKELQRGGQIYYLHNRIGTIEPTLAMLKRIVPHTTIGIAHGRIGEKELIRTMNEFQNKKYGILLATTIIENGIDLPNVNTIIVEDAPNLGLSQAYQLRGRVGRSHRRAYAYFLYGKKLHAKAKLRLQALKEATELGSGYKIALRDMEIRGAGNILGKEQSGSVNTVGLNLYCQMLSDAVEKLKS